MLQSFLCIFLECFLGIFLLLQRGVEFCSAVYSHGEGERGPSCPRRGRGHASPPQTASKLPGEMLVQAWKPDREIHYNHNNRKSIRRVFNSEERLAGLSTAPFLASGSMSLRLAATFSLTRALLHILEGLGSR